MSEFKSANKFEERLESVLVRRQQTEELRCKLVEAIVELNESKRNLVQRQKKWNEFETESLSLAKMNQELKENLVKTLLVKEEKLARKVALETAIEKLNEQIEEMEQETGLYFSSDLVDNLCDRFSSTNQIALMNKIQDAKHKLISRFGYPPSI